MGKNEEKEKLREIEEKERMMKEIIKRYNIVSPVEKRGEASTISLEYRVFKEEELRAKMLNFYEKLCKSAPNLNITLSEEFMEKLNTAIRFTGLKVTPQDVISAGFLMAIISLLSVLPTLFLPIPLYVKLVIILFPVIVAYVIMYYPLYRAAWIRIREGRSLLLAVLYMIVYMKTTPNFEGAVRFAASNLEGKLAQDLKEVLWKVEVGEYTTIEDALFDYLKVWSQYNKEVVEAVHMIRQSLLEPSAERRDAMLSKAIDLVLEEMDEQMKKYVRDLETPVVVLHGLGILLPVMGMIVFPLVSAFMQEVGPNLVKVLFVGYDIILPLIVFILLNQIFMKRPPTHTTVELTQHPDYIPPGKFKIEIVGKRIIIPAIIPTLIVLTIGMYPVLNIMLITNFFFNVSENMRTKSMLVSLVFTLVLAISTAMYYYLSCFQKRKLREEIIEMEKEYEEVLFALGNRLMDDLPIEKALVKAEEDIKGMKIANFLRIVIKNMTQLNMTFKEAIFNNQFGALRYYPSALISAIMKSISDALNKGPRAAALVLLTVGRYIRNIRTTQEKIEDLLSSVVSNLKFQAYVLVPVIAGVVVGVARIILAILAKMSQNMAALNLGNVEGVPSMTLPTFGSGAIPSELLQIIVGVYVLEVLVISGVFIARIEAGDDKIYEHDTVWKILLVGVLLYILIYLIVMAIFGPMVGTVTGAS